LDRIFETKIMSMNTVFNLSGNDNRMFAIDTIASPHRAMLRSIAYTVKVPYSALAKTIHSIGQRGGKVVNVRLLSFLTPDILDVPAAAEAIVLIEEQLAPSPDVLEIPTAVDVIIPVAEQPAQSPPSTNTVNRSKSNSRRQSSKSKRR
jgi:CpcD/allophycocyanin linker domain